MSITRRLFSPFKRQVPTSAYVYMPPKHTWWKAIAAFTAGGICVFALVRSPAGPQAAPEVSRSAAVAAAASQASSPPQAFLAAPTESIPTPTDVATAATQPPEAMPTTAANAKANAKRTATRSAHRQTAKKHRYDLRSRLSRVISTRFRAATADQAVAIAAGALATDITQIN